ncbi:hypothetical protein BDR04DRAFT_937208, partial [Suillus decipiens]
TRLYNILGTKLLVDSVIFCDMDPSQCGLHTDHISILLTLELSTSQANVDPKRKWREVDWKVFNECLQNTLKQSPPVPIAIEEEFQQAACRLMNAITNTMEASVPYSKLCPHSKCWWTKDLSLLHKQVSKASRLAYHMQGLPDHESHKALKKLKNQY